MDQDAFEHGLIALSRLHDRVSAYQRYRMTCGVLAVFVVVSCCVAMYMRNELPLEFVFVWCVLGHGVAIFLVLQAIWPPPAGLLYVRDKLQEALDKGKLS